MKFALSCHVMLCHVMCCHAPCRGLILSTAFNLTAVLFFLEIAEEEEENQIKTSDEDLEEDVFRKRKAELISGAGKMKRHKVLLN